MAEVHTLSDAAIQQLSREVPRSLFRDAVLFGIEQAVNVSLFGKPAVWIPRAVSDDPGGRETVYELPMNEPTLMGFYVVDNQIIKDTFTRTAERSYSRELATQLGEVLFAGSGEIEEIDRRIGYGKIEFRGESTSAAQSFASTAHPSPPTPVWVLWSCIKVN